MTELPPSVHHWREQGRFVEVVGTRVFTLDTGPRDATDVAVVLHGFPTSSHDWHRALEHLRDGSRRLVLLDFPGYGLSDKPEGHGYSLFEQADVLEVVLRELDVHRPHLVAHDMGTSVACELMARRERGLLSFAPRSLLLMNGSVHIELARLTPSQRLLRSPLGPAFARVGSSRVFHMQLRRILARPVPSEELDAMWAQLVHNDGRRRLPHLIEYLDERRRFWHRWIGALQRLRDLPTHVLWATEDPVAVLAIGRRLAEEIPDAVLETLDGLGHYPQLEDPARTARAIAAFLDRADGLGQAGD